MKTRLIFALIALAAISTAAHSQEQSRKDRLRDYVYYFASDSLQGRQAGSVYAAKAAAFLVKEYEAIGLEPLFGDSPIINFEQHGGKYRDVAFKLEGSDPVLKDEYIVLGAHYDHLGVRDGQVYNGADDNASGTAALIEVARELKAHQAELKRSVVFAAFDAEELGLFGSNHLAQVMADSLGIEKVKLMMSLDMVGWYAKSGLLYLEGVATVKNGRKLLDCEAEKTGINVKLKNFETSVFTATDTFGFAAMKVPTFDVTTGLKSPYHKPEDDADLIDYEGMDKVSQYVSNVTLVAASDPEFAGTGRIAAKHQEDGKTFNLGVVGNVGSSRMLFKQGGIQTTKPGFSYSGGLQARLNFGPHNTLGLQASALYEVQQARYPDIADLYGNSFKYGQKALSVPALLMLQTKGLGKAFIGVGGYYSHLFEGGLKDGAEGLTPSESQGGLAFSFGAKVGAIQFSCDVRRQLSPLFVEKSAPKAGLTCCCFSLGYFFL